MVSKGGVPKGRIIPVYLTDEGDVYPIYLHEMGELEICLLYTSPSPRDA